MKLYSKELFSKWGFDDGDLFDTHEELERLVKKQELK